MNNGVRCESKALVSHGDVVMRNHCRIIDAVFCSVVLLIAAPVSAGWLSTDNLPATLAAELASGTVQTEIINGEVQSYASRNGISAYAFQRNGDPFILISYDALTGSQWDTNFADPIPLSGQVFLEAPQFYIPGNTAQFTLYFDQLSFGMPASAFWSNMPQTTFVLQPDAMAAGTGVYQLSGEPDYIESGNMDFATFGDEPFICIECSFFAQLDLVFLDYSGVALDLNFDDSRTTLFTGFDTFDGPPYGWGLDLVVNQVPLPGGLPLMLTAVVPLLLNRKQRNRACSKT